MRTQNWSRENLAWAAGLAEGEGCWTVTLRKRKSPAPMFRFNMSHTDLDVLRRFQEVMGFGSVNPKKRTKAKATHKDQWQHQTTCNADFYALAAALYPWLYSRRQGRIQALLKQFASYHTPARVAPPIDPKTGRFMKAIA